MATTGNLQSIINVILTSVIDPLIPILIGLAVIVFAWGLFNYLKTGLGETKDLNSAKSLMFWGAIIIFVMVSVWGLVAILQDVFFGVIGTSSNTVPTINKFGL
ncbi:MAG: hypothetical protein NT041_00945 [Candidatus Vogelbacteria bacterium]|nr:hypothetical protein [Candidatus Vogelbacteria bacterium]